MERLSPLLDFGFEVFCIHAFFRLALYIDTYILITTTFARESFQLEDVAKYVAVSSDLLLPHSHFCALFESARGC